MGFILLEESALSTAGTIFFGLIGMVVAVALIIYMKAGISSLTNSRYIDRSGRTVITPDTFKDINAFVGEKVIDAKNKILGTYKVEPIKCSAPFTKSPQVAEEVDYDKLKPAIGLYNYTIGKKYFGYDDFRTTYNQNGIVLTNYDKGIALYYQPPILGYLKEVAIFEPNKAATKEGIGIGSTVQAVFNTYGPADLKGSKGTDLMFACYEGIKFGYKLNGQGKLIPNDERKIEFIRVY